MVHAYGILKAALTGKGVKDPGENEKLVAGKIGSLPRRRGVLNWGSYAAGNDARPPT